MSQAGIPAAGGVGIQERDALRGTEAGKGGGHDAAAPARRRWPWLLATVAVAGFAAVVLAKIFLPTSEVWTDDAYVAVHSATVAPRVAGQVATVAVDDNQAVRAGQVLATLDARDYATAVARAEALLARDRAQARNVTAAIDRQPSLIAQDRAQAAAARARLGFSRGMPGATITSPPRAPAAPRNASSPR